MIDLHSHLIPGLDDGAPNIETSLKMARLFVSDGVSTVACTPHILQGLYPNHPSTIRQATAELETRLQEQGIPLQLVTGADNHIVSDFATKLQSGDLLSLADGPYVLVELPHNVALLHLESFFLNLISSGFVPILTHPERLSWFKSHYSLITRLADVGVWMQITAGSLLGQFGKTAQSAAEHMLENGVVHILATDAHDVQHRPPNLGAGRMAAARIVGSEEAEHLVLTRPKAVLAHASPTSVPLPWGSKSHSSGKLRQYV